MEQQNPSPTVPQDLDNGTPLVQETNSTLPLQEPKAKKKKFVLIFILVFLFLIILGLLTYYFFTKDNNVVEEEVKEDSKISVELEVEEEEEKEEEVQEEVVKRDFTNRIFFKKDEGLFSYNIETGETLKWLGSDVKHFFEIDKNNIGFSIENSESFPYQYTINTFNIQTGEEKELLRVENLQSLGFYSPEKFAYEIFADSLEDSSMAETKVFLYESGNTLEIHKTLSPITGLAADLLDSVGITRTLGFKFSPDGNSFIFSCLFCESGQILYKIKEKSKENISLSQAIWLDNDRILFTSGALQEGETKLGIYTIDTQTEEYINIQSQYAVLPDAISSFNKILYSHEKISEEDRTEDLNIWIYDLDLNEDTKIIENGWNARWINPETFLYFKVAGDTENPYLDISYFKFSDVKIFSLNGNRELELPEEVRENVLNKDSIEDILLF